MSSLKSYSSTSTGSRAGASAVENKLSWGCRVLFFTTTTTTATTYYCANSTNPAGPADAHFPLPR